MTESNTLFTQIIYLTKKCLINRFKLIKKMFSVTQFEVGVSARSLTVVKDPSKQLSVRCALSVSNGLNENFIETDRTEFSEDSLNPDWSKRFIIAYKFSEIQALRFDLYLSLNKIGESKIALIELLSAKDGFIMKAIKSGNDKIGKLLITYKECENNKEFISMQFSGKNLDKKDLFGQSDPYLVISNVDRNGNTTKVHKTEVIKQNINPIWNPIKINAKTLCQSDHKMVLGFDCFDWDSDIKIKDKKDYIGSFNTTLDRLLNGNPDENFYELINAEKLAQNVDSYKNSGYIYLESISVTYGESFLDNLRRGLQLHSSISIDFTAALNFIEFKNRNKINSKDLNDCHIIESFISGFCQIIKQYNRQNIWTASGFNAIFANNDCNDFYEFKPNAFYENYDQIIAEFNSLMNSVKPINSTKHFGSIVDKNVEWIEKLVGCDSDRISRYSVLIILTADLTKDNLKNLDEMIEKTKSSPISILIIDMNLNGSTKELDDITKIMNASEALDNRNNIEVENC